MQDPTKHHRYTRYFCEENVWWLVHDRRQAGVADDRSWVLLFTNADAAIAVMNQRAAPPGTLIAWDYHVVLAAPSGGTLQIYDLDSRLPFPSPWPEYIAGTFPDQSALPRYWRAWVRQIPAMSYLARFCSDRRHMRGKLPLSAFPDYPPLCPTDATRGISLSAYQDLQRPLDDGSLVAPVQLAQDGPITA